MHRYSRPDSQSGLDLGVRQIAKPCAGKPPRRRDRGQFEQDEVLRTSVLSDSRLSERPHSGSLTSSAASITKSRGEIIDMRNRVMHGYFDIDSDVVWNTIMNDLAALEQAIATQRAPASGGVGMCAPYELIDDPPGLVCSNDGPNLLDELDELDELDGGRQCSR